MRESCQRPGGPVESLIMADLKELREGIDRVRAELEQRLTSLTDQATLESFRIEFLGRKGRIGQLFQALGRIAPEERAEAGKLLNELKTSANAIFEARRSALENAILESRIAKERVDLTLPGVYHPLGHRHLLTQVQARSNRSSCGWGLMSRPVRRLRASTTTSRRSTSRPTILRATIGTPSTSMRRPCCGRTPLRCRSG